MALGKEGTGDSDTFLIPLSLEAAKGQTTPLAA